MRAEARGEKREAGAAERKEEKKKRKRRRTDLPECNGWRRWKRTAEQRIQSRLCSREVSVGSAGSE
jgi:hypothetical protein